MAFFVPYLILISANAHSHDPGNLNEEIIGRTNDTVAEKVLAVQLLLTELLRSAGGASLPEQNLNDLIGDLNHMKEDVALSLEYYANQGLNLSDKETLKANPVAGRAVVADRAVVTSLALLAHVTTLQDRDAFVREIYSKGLSYYMYDALGAYRDSLALYASIGNCSHGTVDAEQE